MTKQYRKSNEVIAMYGGRSSAGRDTLDPKTELKGMTPRQHCEQLIATRKSGHFKTVSPGEDVCMLYSCNFWGDCYEAAEYSYHYTVCTEIDFTATIDGKAAQAVDLTRLSGGERVIIRANQAVTWSLNPAVTLDEPAQNETTYAFTVPQTGKFSVQATGKCDPNAHKTVTVSVRPKSAPLNLTEQDVHDIVKVASTEVELRMPDKDIKQQTAGVVDTVLNRAYQKNGDVRAVINANGQFSQISGNKGAYGSVQNMPDRDIKPKVRDEVLVHLKYRANGGASSIGGHMNYLNPHKSSEKSLREWGNDVVAQARQSGLIFGVEPHVHYHGTARGVKQAPDFEVRLPAKYR